MQAVTGSKNRNGKKIIKTGVFDGFHTIVYGHNILLLTGI